MSKENARYKIMVTHLDNTFHNTDTDEYDGVVYDSLSIAKYYLELARKDILYNRSVCNVFLKEVTA